MKKIDKFEEKCCSMPLNKLNKMKTKIVNLRFWSKNHTVNTEATRKASTTVRVVRKVIEDDDGEVVEVIVVIVDE